MKKCSKCKVAKPLTEFYIAPSQPGGFYNYCRPSARYGLEMTNVEKRELRAFCKLGYSFDRIRLLVDCSDATIRQYLKQFSPTLESGREPK